MSKEAQQNLLSSPLHGVLIPGLLLVVGTVIMDRSKWAYAVAAAVLLGTLKFYRGRTRTVGSEFVTVELVDKYPVSHDMSIYEFAFPQENHRLGLRAGEHYTVRANVGGEMLERCYTPLSVNETGKFDLMVKARGPFSRQLETLSEHETIEVRVDRDDGRQFAYEANRYGQLNMVAGGSGVTPMLQILDAIVKNPQDMTRIKLIFANDTIDDIPLIDELEEMASKYPRFELTYLLREMPEDNTINATIGIVSKEVLEKHLAAPCEKSLTLVCGPDQMCGAAKAPLSELGHEFYIF